MDPPFFFFGGGGGGSLSLVLVVLAWLLQLLFCPGDGFLGLFAGVSLLSTSSVAGSSGWFALALRFSLDGFMVRTRCPSIS